MVYVDVYKTWMEATYEYDIPNKDMFEVHNMQVKLQRSDMEYAHGVVLGQLRTGDNAPMQDKNKAQLLPTRTAVPRTTPHYRTTPHQNNIKQ